MPHTRCPIQDAPYKGLLGLEPIESGSEAEDAHEAGGGLLVAGRDGAPLLEPCPEPLDLVAIVINPVRASDWCLVVFGRNSRTCAALPDVLAEGVTAQAPVSHHPLRHTGQAVEERDGLRQLMSLTRSQDEGHRPSEAVGDHASFGPIAPTRAAQRLTLVPLSLRPLFERHRLPSGAPGCWSHRETSSQAARPGPARGAVGAPRRPGEPSGGRSERHGPRDPVQRGWRATSLRSGAARRWPRSCDGDPAAGSCPWAGRPRSAAPASSIARRLASLPPPLSREAKRQQTHPVQARTGPSTRATR